MKYVQRALLLVVVWLACINGAAASSTLGTIDPRAVGNWKALFENATLTSAPTLNFGKFTTQAIHNITVSNTELRGLAWGEGTGWIITNCADTTSGCTGANGNFKVANDGTGNLSGYAWGENTGWVNFGPFTNSAVSTVKITNGLFGGTLGDAGYAWAQNYGWIKFDCSNPASCVETDWRRPTCSDGIQNQGETGIDTGGPCPVIYPVQGQQGPQGSIKISAFTCAERPLSMTRSVNGPTAQGSFTIPPTCTPLEGAEFGSVFMPGKYNGSGGYPYIHGEALFNVIGITGNLGELLRGGYSTLGRYNIAETYNGGVLLPHNSRYAFFCYGDKGGWADNLDYTFVPKDGTTYCVTYRSNDLCPNIAGNQLLVPNGAYINNVGDCILPPNPNDLCPNIVGNQATMPSGKILNSAGQCVDIVIPDACPNITGYQASVPSDQQYDAVGDCVPLDSSGDLCLNIGGVQSVVPLNTVRDNAGNCTSVQTPSCFDGIRNQNETGVDTGGVCVKPPNPPGVATCSDRIQNQNETGVDTGGVCGEKQNPPALCVLFPNLPICVPPTPPPTPPPVNNGGPQETLLGGGNSISNLSSSYMGSFLAPLFPIDGNNAFINFITASGLVLPVASGMVSFVVANPILAKDVPLLAIQLWNSILIAFGFKKRKQPWGIVYDSVTKHPIDPAYVVLMDMAGNEVATAITDMDGRYGFAVDPGTYRIVANKTNYQFPSTKLTGKSSDGLYDDLYFGEEVVVTKEGDIITKNIPLDQLAFDWNEYTKTHGGTYGMKLAFYRTSDIVLYRVSRILFVVGFAYAIYALIFSPILFNILVFGLYMVMLLVQLFVPGFHKKGSVRSKDTKKPRPFSVVRIISAVTNKEVAHKVADRVGNYYGLVHNGLYTFTIDTKKETTVPSVIPADGASTLEYDTHVIDKYVKVKKGYLKEDFRV